MACSAGWPTMSGKGRVMEAGVSETEGVGEAGAFIGAGVLEAAAKDVGVNMDVEAEIVGVFAPERERGANNAQKKGKINHIFPNDVPFIFYPLKAEPPLLSWRERKLDFCPLAQLKK